MRKGYAMTSDKKRFNSIQKVADELGVSESIAWSMERRKMFDRPESKGIARPYVIPDWLREARDTALPTDRLPALFVRMHPNMKADEEPFINHLHEHHSTMRYLMTERAENMRFTLPIKVSERTVAKAQGLPVLFVYSQIVRFGGILLGQAYFEGTGSILAVKPFAPDDPMLNTYLPNTMPGGETRLLFSSDLEEDERKEENMSSKVVDPKLHPNERLPFYCNRVGDGFWNRVKKVVGRSLDEVIPYREESMYGGLINGRELLQMWDRIPASLFSPKIESLGNGHALTHLLTEEFRDFIIYSVLSPDGRYAGSMHHNNSIRDDFAIDKLTTLLVHVLMCDRLEIEAKYFRDNVVANSRCGRGAVSFSDLLRSMSTVSTEHRDGRDRIEIEIEVLDDVDTWQVFPSIKSVTYEHDSVEEFLSEDQKVARSISNGDRRSTRRSTRGRRDSGADCTHDG